MGWVKEVLVVVVLVVFGAVNGEPSGDKRALIDFMNSVPHGRRLNWNANSSACFWVGVICNANKDRIWTLRLPGVGLFGQIPDATLGRLTELRVLSLRSNRLTGALPKDMSNLKVLRSLYLQHNLLSGPLPEGLYSWVRLGHLDLSFNRFSGSVPFAFNSLTRLTVLHLENNSLTGSLPNLNLPNLTIFSVANNHLNGSIPTSLEKFNRSSFEGNAGLCGKPLQKCQSFFPPVPPPLRCPLPISRRISSARASLRLFRWALPRFFSSCWPACSYVTVRERGARGLVQRRRRRPELRR